jgi:hypothetical protein
MTEKSFGVIQTEDYTWIWWLRNADDVTIFSERYFYSEQGAQDALEDYLDQE